MTETENLITVTEMSDLFGVGRDTIYRKYCPFLTRIPSTDNRAYFNKDAAIAIHRKILNEIEQKRKSGQRGNFGKYKII